MKINWKKLILIVLGTILIGSVPSIFINTTTAGLNVPKLNPPSFLFPIVWTIIYILMGISCYLIYEKTKKIEKIYIVQLIVNSLWTIIFFGLKLRLLAFFWILFLIGLVIEMITKFYNIDKKAGIMNIPYLLWLLFASYLNLAIYLLNR